MEKQTRRFLTFALLFSVAHFVLLCLVGLFYGSVRIRGLQDYHDTTILEVISGFIFSVLDQPFNFIMDVLIREHKSVIHRWFFAFLNSLLWGFTLSSIIFFLKNRKTQILSKN